MARVRSLKVIVCNMQICATNLAAFYHNYISFYSHFFISQVNNLWVSLLRILSAYYSNHWMR